MEVRQHSGTEVPSLELKSERQGRVKILPDRGKPHTQGMYTGLHLGQAAYRRAF